MYNFYNPSCSLLFFGGASGLVFDLMLFADVVEASCYVHKQVEAHETFCLGHRPGLRGSYCRFHDGALLLVYIEVYMHILIYFFGM